MSVSQRVPFGVSSLSGLWRFELYLYMAIYRDIRGWGFVLGVKGFGLEGFLTTLGFRVSGRAKFHRGICNRQFYG